MRNHHQVQVFRVGAAVSVGSRVLVNVRLAVIRAVPFIGAALGYAHFQMHVLDFWQNSQIQRYHRVAVGVLYQMRVRAGLVQ